MTRMRVIDEAEQDLLEAMEWYEARRTGLGDELSDGYEDALRSIVRNPRSFARSLVSHGISDVAF